MDINKDKYIILEIIPTAIDPNKGDVAQLSALKIDGLKLIDRFDYRLKEELIHIPQIVDMINYDKESFIYKDKTKDILDEFIKWIEDYNLLFIDNEYTLNYIKDISNNKESIFKYLNEVYSHDVIDKIINKYELEPSNYIVDLLYESLMKEY